MLVFTHITFEQSRLRNNVHIHVALLRSTTSILSYAMNFFLKRNSRNMNRKMQMKGKLSFCQHLRTHGENPDFRKGKTKVQTTVSEQTFDSNIASTSIEVHIYVIMFSVVLKDGCDMKGCMFRL